MKKLFFLCTMAGCVREPVDYGTCPCWLNQGSYCSTVVANYAEETGCKVVGLAENEGNLLYCEGDSTAGSWSLLEGCDRGCNVEADYSWDTCVGEERMDVEPFVAADLDAGWVPTEVEGE